MEKTQMLGLPIYAPEDIFDLTEVNKAHKNIEIAYQAMEGIQSVNANAEVIGARKGEINLKTKIDKIDDAIEANANEIALVNDFANVLEEDIEDINSQLEQKNNNLQSQINNLVINGDGTQNLEVVQARVDLKGNTFDTLKDRNDNFERLLFEKTTVFNNIIFEQGGAGSSGDYTANNRLRSIGYFSIKGKFTISVDSLWKYNVLEYNSSGTLIKNYGFVSIETTIKGTSENKFRLVLGKNDDTTITPNLLVDVLTITYTPSYGIFADLEQIYTLNNCFTYKELSYLKTELGYYQQGVFVTSSTNTTYYYDVKGLKAVNLTTAQTQYKNIFTLLDDDYGVISYLRVDDASLSYSNKKIELNGVSYIAISEVKSNPVENKKVTYLTTITKNEETTETKGKWYGKRFVWFGTSIPAGAKEGKDNPLSYPMKLGERLGATVINEAVGESSLHCKAVHRISESNPYGFEENWNKCARCLTNTLEEVEWLLANWNNTNVFTTGTLTALTEDDKAFYRRCSYENKLLPHLNSENVDLFVLDHGHNDRYNANKKNGANVDDSIIMQEYGEFNLYTFEGASNFIINKILTANPKNRICFIGEYENQKLPLVSQFQSKVADKWCYPIYKQWEKLGWTQNKIFTTGYWNNSTGLWIESGGEEQQITMLKRWIRDNIHPSSDNSGKATEWLLENMEVWFSNNL